MSDAITKAVIALEKHYGPIKKIPEPIMRKWRAEHRELMIDGENYNKHLSKLNEDKRIKAIKEFNIRIAAENDKSKAWLDATMPADVVRGSQKNAIHVYSLELAEAVQYIGKLSNAKIANKVGVKYDKLVNFVARTTNNKYYFLSVKGDLYEADRIIELRDKILKDGYAFSASNFNSRVSRGGYLNKGKRVVGKLSKQLIIKRVQVVDTTGNVIKEV